MFRRCKEWQTRPRSLSKAAEILSRNPGECVVFEDSPHGIEAGKLAGMKTVALTTSHPSNTFMHLNPDLIVDSLALVDPAQINHLFD